MTALMSGPINDLNKVIKSKSSKVCLVSDSSGLYKWIFMSPTIQTSPGRWFI